MPILFPAVVEDLVNWLMFNATIVVNTGIFQRITDSEQMLHVNSCRNITYEQDSCIWNYGNNEYYDGKMNYDGEH